MFPTIESGLSFIKQYAEINDNPEHDNLLVSYLEASKAKFNGQDEYRPLIVAGYFLEFKRLRDGVIEVEGTDGVKFESADLKINGFFTNQRLLDKALTDIPKAWSFEAKLKAFGAFVV